MEYTNTLCLRMYTVYAYIVAGHTPVRGICAYCDWTYTGRRTLSLVDIVVGHTQARCDCVYCACMTLWLDIHWCIVYVCIVYVYIVAGHIQAHCVCV